MLQCLNVPHLSRALRQVLLAEKALLPAGQAISRFKLIHGSELVRCGVKLEHLGTGENEKVEARAQGVLHNRDEVTSVPASGPVNIRNPKSSCATWECSPYS